MMCDIIVFENLCFRPPTRKRKVGVLKIFTLGQFLKTSVFGARKRRLCLHGKLNTINK